MKKLLRKTLLSLSIVLSSAPLWASGICYLEDVEECMKKVLLSTPPHEVVLVLDLDGTLTDRSRPGEEIAKPRGNAVAFVKDMVARGVKVVVSSAWNVFEETLRRIDDLGLTETLKVNEIRKRSNVEANFGDLKNARVDVFQAGLVCSVRDPNVSSKYYRDKLFAVTFVYPDLDHTLIKELVFADDSTSNFGIFTYDRQRSNLFPKATLRPFPLSEANGENTLK